MKKDENYKGYIIRTDLKYDEYIYIIFGVKESGKWIRRRAMQGYDSSYEALTKAKNYIDKYLKEVT